MLAHEQPPLLGFTCLNFPGRSTVTLQEIAGKLGISCDTLERLVDSGDLVALDLKRTGASRRYLKVAIDEYHRFVLSRLTMQERRAFIANLPNETLREIAAEIAARLAAA